MIGSGALKPDCLRVLECGMLISVGWHAQRSNHMLECPQSHQPCSHVCSAYSFSGVADLQAVVSACLLTVPCVPLMLCFCVALHVYVHQYRIGALSINLVDAATNQINSTLYESFPHLVARPKRENQDKDQLVSGAR